MYLYMRMSLIELLFYDGVIGRGRQNEPGGGQTAGY